MNIDKILNNVNYSSISIADMMQITGGRMAARFACNCYDGNGILTDSGNAGSIKECEKFCGLHDDQAGPKE